MISTPMTTDIHKESRKRLAAAAVTRVESVAIIALTLGALFMATLNFALTREIWWALVLAGVCGETVIITRTMRDRDHLARISSQLFYQRFGADQLRTADLQRGMSRVLECHREIFQAIRQRPGAPLGALAQHVDDWAVQAFQLAKRMDSFMFDPGVRSNVLQLVERVQSDIQGAPQVALAITRTNTGAADTNHAALDEIRRIMNCSLNELQASLFAMSLLRGQLQTLPAAQINSDLTGRANSVVAEHMTRLEDACDKIDQICRLHGEPQQ